MPMLSLRQYQILQRAKIKVKRIFPYLHPGDTILDIGCGNGGVNYLLSKKHGLQLVPLDITDKSQFPSIKPQIYDGSKLPFGEDAYPTVMLLTVLHHTPTPNDLVREASRIASDRVIIMEDIYANRLQKWLTFFMDSLVNWEFKGHPHSNKTDKEWRGLFESCDLELENADYHRVGIVFRQVTYVLKKKKGRS